VEADGTAISPAAAATPAAIAALVVRLLSSLPGLIVLTMMLTTLFSPFLYIMERRVNCGT